MNKQTGGFDERPGESPAERADRNFSDILQELRVTQTGVQILFAFLLTLVFQPGFDKLDDFEVLVYVVTVIFCACAAIILIAPVALHRSMFRLGRKAEVVDGSDRLARIGIALLSVGLTGATLLALDVPLPRWLALLIVGAIALMLVIVWYIIPMRAARRPAKPEWTG